MDKYHTQWAGQFYVAAELTRRGFAVTLTLGNARRTDLVVVTPSGKLFKVEVKAQRTKNFWIVSEPPTAEDHFYILVYVPKPPKPPEFFVMSCADCQGLRMLECLEALVKNAGRPQSPITLTEISEAVRSAGIVSVVSRAATTGLVDRSLVLRLVALPAFFWLGGFLGLGAVAAALPFFVKLGSKKFPSSKDD